ncbi:p115 like vesicle tethering protein [Melampsora americana]|nr:p115 like vesicle tethering protein [Melampsora americana]
MSFLSSIQGTVLQGYAALQGAQGQPQSATETLSKLVDRLQNSVQHEDRRSSLLGIKGMARDWKSEVGRLALPAILDVLCREDLADDVDMAKSVLETLHVLCEVEENETGKLSKTGSGLANVDVFLKASQAAHALLKLLALPHFYVRFFSLQLLGTLLTAPAPRPHTLQSYLLTAPGGLGTILSILDDTREIIRNEALLLLISITEKNADIQKIIAFEGGFDRLFNIISLESGIGGGGIVVQDCLICIGQLLRYNVSNQNYFRETSCIPHLAPMLLFPPMTNPSDEALDAFATQPWTAQKVTNAALVISLARTLVAGGGTGKSANQKALLNGGFTRCLAEIGLASTSPPSLKAEALNVLANVIKGSQVNQEFMGRLVISPIAVSLAPDVSHSPRPTESDGPNPSSTEQNPNQAAAELYREAPQAAVLSLMSLSIDGLPGLRNLNVTGDRDILRVRAAAVNVLDAYLFGNSDAQTGLASTMRILPPSVEPGTNNDRPPHSPGSLLLEALRTLPASPNIDSYTSFFACLIFTYLLRGSEHAKEIARQIKMGGDDTTEQQLPAESDEDSEQTSLVQLLMGNLMMAQRAQGHDNNAGEGLQRSSDWTRIMIGYLIVLASWLWDSPLTTTEMLSEGTNLQVLIEPVGQATGVDPLVQGLCAFVLGIVYENDRDPNSPIPRATLQPILQSRIGPDQFVNRILRLREDPRFTNIGPDVLELSEQTAPSSNDNDHSLTAGLWFDWPFVEFFKAHYVSVQHSILSDPVSSTSSRPTTEDDSRQNELIARLKAQIADQAKDLQALEQKVEQLTLEREDDVFSKEIKSLTEEVETLKEEAEKMMAAQKESEKEQEDLLVLLEEVTNKRKSDKALMKEKGLDVSEDEDESE